MMRKIIIFIGLFLIFPAFVCAQNFSSKKEEIIIAEPGKSLKIGERLEYSVEWLGVYVGKITLQVEGIKNIDGHDCYHITAHAMPNRYLAKLYDVEYTVHSYIDTKSLYTRRFEKTRRVKDKYSHVIIDFDRENKQVKYRTEGSAPLVNIAGVREETRAGVARTLKIINGTQDLFSSIYYLRLLEIKEERSYDISIYYDKKNWPLHMKVGKPFIRDIRRQGAFAVFEISMDSALGAFILGKSRMVVYFTADSRRIPMEFRFGTGIGFVRGVIRDISG